MVAWFAEEVIEKEETLVAAVDLNQRDLPEAFVCVSKCGAGQSRKVCIVKPSHFRGSLHHTDIRLVRPGYRSFIGKTWVLQL